MESRSRTDAAPAIGAALLVVTSAALLVRVLLDRPDFTAADLADPGDSGDYLSAAASWSATGVLTDSQGQPLTLFPPGFPLLLGTLMRLGLSLSAASFAVSVASLVVSVSTLWFLSRRSLGSPWLALLVTALFAVNPSVIAVFARPWTEGPFTAVVMVAGLVAVVVVQNRAMRVRGVVILIALAWIASTLRYAGVVIAVLAAVVWWTAAPQRGHRRGLQSLLVLALASVALVVLAGRNISLGSGPFGDRREGYLTFESTVVGTFEQFGRAIVSPTTSGLSGTIGILLAALLGAAVWRAWRTRDTPLEILSLLVLAYWVVLWASQVSSHIDEPGERFLTPILGPMLILWVCVGKAGVDALVTELRARDHPHLARVPEPLAITVIGASLLVSAVLSLRLAG